MPRNIMRGMAAFNQVCQRFGVNISKSAATTKPSVDPQQLCLSDSRRFLRMSATQWKPKTWQRILVFNWRLATLDRMILQNQLVLTSIIVQVIDERCFYARATCLFVFTEETDAGQSVQKRKMPFTFVQSVCSCQHLIYFRPCKNGWPFLFPRYDGPKIFERKHLNCFPSSP